GEIRVQGSSESGGTQPDEEFVESAEAEAEAEIENVHEAEEVPEGSEDNTDWWDQGWQGGWDSWTQEPYSSSYGWWKGRPGGSAASWATWDASATASAQAERFLPDFVIAWLLLQRSGLDTTEKSVIVANFQGRQGEASADEKATSGNTGDQRVHFVFSAVDDRTTAEPDAKDDDTAATETSLLALDEIVATGKAIIDGGATSSLGSEEALQQVAMLNWKATGRDSIEIVPEERPSFRFGNKAQHTCLSTALLRLPISCKDSQMRVHIHDIPGQPVLLSVKSLRALGAVIDFSNDQAVFKALDPKAVVSLETTSSGHQLFPLARDVLEGATPLEHPFSSFQQYVKTAHPGH
ncbi:unnamed protein product, partial [Symbiodinium sp. CCMP2456]